MIDDDAIYNNVDNNNNTIFFTDWLIEWINNRQRYENEKAAQQEKLFV